MNMTVLLLAAALSAGSQEFDETATRGAAEMVVRKAREELVSRPLDGTPLREAMLAEPDRFLTRDKAELACRPLYSAAVEKRLATESEAVLRRLAGTEDPAKVFGTNFVAEAVRLDEYLVRKVMEGPFVSAFSQARKAACEEQARSLVRDIRPSVGELDGDDDAKMCEAMAARVVASQKKPIFHENLAYVSEKIVPPMIEAAKKEKRRQGDYVRRVRSDAYAPEALAHDLADKLAANVKERNAKAESPATVWDVFPSVTNVTLRNTVDRRIVGRFAAKAGEIQFASDPDAFAKAFADDEAAHRTAEDSLRILRTAEGARLLAAARAAAVSDAPEKEREALDAYLGGRLADREVTQAAERRLDDGFVPVWRKAREGFVEREFAATWPTLADRTWYPDAETADDLCGRSDYAAAVGGWRATSALRETGVVLEESAAKADAAVREGFELARSAIVAQTRIVEGEMPGVLKESRARKDSFWRRTPDLQAIVAMLTEATEKRWTESKVATLWPVAGTAPENALEQHTELFPSVRRKIELVAKSIFEQMQEPVPEEKPQPQPETQSESDGEGESDEEPEMEFSISVRRAGGSVEVKLERGKETLDSRTVPAERTAFEQAMKAISEKLSRDVMKLR